MLSEDLGGLESLQVLLQQNPNSLTFGRVADALLKMDRVDEAIQLCEDGLRRHPSYVTGHMVLGKCYLKKKLFDQAEKEFKRVLLFDPKYLAAHKYYGDLMREIGWDNTCEMSYRKILQIDPFDENVRTVVEELAQKTKAGKPEPAPIRREARPPAAAAVTTKTMEPFVPIQPQEDFSPTGVDESDLLRYQPAIADAASKQEFETPASPAPEEVSSTQLPPDADEERYSYILDDIFQDEVFDDKPAAPPANKTPQPPGRLETRREDEFSPHESRRFVEPPPIRATDNSALGRDQLAHALGENDDKSSRHPTPPDDFEVNFDDLPPADLTDSEKSSDFDFEPAKPAANSAPVRPSRVPARRPKTLEEQGYDETSPAAPGEREKIVTPTLGEIYAAQGQYAKAIGVFELLSKKEPGNKHYREKIDYLKKRLQETQNAG
ncbi:MAG: tetratricopeptide repeat protein [candidate division KSB1 bacterium]|nr:tetratricopeptide repeat protein [candidate division KSB1 bacterium]MDZ7366966.1 tetratricopeptide repeat protein [candidate division KSB1 bacterium]MDZ7406851.1 tetratricopeptide repeat protein [candidate division KSB1 bacterium]